MPKKCIICEESANFSIKGTSDYYCKECAIDHFGDTDLLVRVEEKARLLKKLIEETKIKKDEEIGENQYLPDEE